MGHPLSFIGAGECQVMFARFTALYDLVPRFDSVVPRLHILYYSILENFRVRAAGGRVVLCALCVLWGGIGGF